MGDDQLNLIEFINQYPYAILSADYKGTINLLNAAASKLLLPISFKLKVGSENILSLIGELDSDLKGEILSFSKDHGRICNQYRVQFEIEENRLQYLSFTIVKIRKDLYQYAFQDITELVENQDRLNKMIEKSALQEGRLEMSSGVLHDIGNAATAFGTEVSKLKNKLNWREEEDLEKLIKLFHSKSEGLDHVLGRGKSKALEKFLKALQSSIEEKKEVVNQSTSKLFNTTSHIQQILNIQRHYAEGKKDSEREKINVSIVIDDALSIQEKILLKRNISIEKELSLDIPPIKGDKTKLIQVLINLIKNAAEAFDAFEEKEKNQKIIIRTYFEKSKNKLSIEIEDNAIGFEPGQEERFFKKGETTKTSGSGFGLMNCRKIIQSHDGEINIMSKGPSKGAIVIIKLPVL